MLMKNAARRCHVTFCLSAALIACMGVTPGVVKRANAQTADVSVENVETAPAQPPRIAVPLTQTQRLAARLINPQVDAHLRTAAAYDLIRQDTSAAASIIRQGLANHADPGTQRAILSALLAYPQPPRELAAILLAAFEKADASLIHDMAWALGRYDDHMLLRDLASLAQGNDTPLPTRVGAILTLGHQRTMTSAKLLMKLIEPQEPEAVRLAAFESLGVLAGTPERGVNIASWQQWWEENSKLSPARWDALLLARFSQRAELLERERQQVVNRLVDSQRQLLRATAHEQRPSLLVAMLQDPLEPIRQLAVEQLDQRARAGEVTDAALREGLLERLGDASPSVRLASVKLLRNLRDEAGSRDRTAQVIADRLTSLDETNEDVLRAYLLLLADTPVQSAVDRAMDLLRSASLREDAAGAIASAIDKKLVSDKDIELLNTLFLRLVPGDRPPEPKMIELLGRVGGESVWRRIALWLEDSDERVRLASARAWAQSDRSLVGLAPYSKVPALQPIIIDAAYRRGRSVVTLMELIRNKPQQEQLAQSWQAALVAMAARLPHDSVLQADAELARRQESLALRAAFVGAAVAAMDQSHALNPMGNSALAVMIDLNLHNARLLLGTGSAESAWGQLNKLDKLDLTQSPLTTRQQVAMDQLRLEILSAMGDLDRAVAQSDQMLSRVASMDIGARQAILRPMVALFSNWSARSITTSQYDQANRILLYVRDQFSDVLTGDHKTQLALMEAQVQRVRTPPAATAATTPATPTTQPATTPSTLTAGSTPATSPATSPASRPANDPDAASDKSDPAAPAASAAPSTSAGRAEVSGSKPASDTTSASPVNASDDELR